MNSIQEVCKQKMNAHEKEAQTMWAVILCDRGLKPMTQ